MLPKNKCPVCNKKMNDFYEIFDQVKYIDIKKERVSQAWNTRLLEKRGLKEMD